MIGRKNLPKVVLKQAYKLAVSSTLSHVFELAPARAQDITEDWWNRLSKTSAMKSGIFLHSEPIKTAALLLGRERPALEGEARTSYRAILRESLEMAVKKHRSTKRRVLETDDGRISRTRVPARMAS